MAKKKSSKKSSQKNKNAGNRNKSQQQANSVTTESTHVDIDPKDELHTTMEDQIEVDEVLSTDSVHDQEVVEDFTKTQGAIDEESSTDSNDHEVPSSRPCDNISNQCLAENDSGENVQTCAETDDAVVPSSAVASPLDENKENLENGNANVDVKISDVAKEKEPKQTESMFNPETYIKHPLEDTWTFWFYQGDKKKSWRDNLIQVIDVSTVEDFWSVFSNIVEPSRLQPGRDYSLFKKNIRPEWEDPRNNHGGMWSVTFRYQGPPTSMGGRSSGCDMNALWREITMALVGNHFDGSMADVVNGATYSARKNQDRVALWIGVGMKEKALVEAIGQKLREAVSHAECMRGGNWILDFATSEDWKCKSGSTATSRFTIKV